MASIFYDRIWQWRVYPQFIRLIFEALEFLHLMENSINFDERFQRLHRGAGRRRLVATLEIQSGSLPSMNPGSNLNNYVKEKGTENAVDGAHLHRRRMRSDPVTLFQDGNNGFINDWTYREY